MKAYSLDLRQKVLAAALRGDRTVREVAETFGVGTIFVDKVLALHCAGKDFAPRPHGGGYPARLLPGMRSCCAPRCGGVRTPRSKSCAPTSKPRPGSWSAPRRSRGPWPGSTCRVKKSLAASERNNYNRGWFRRRARRVNHR
jgi:hypothetical protein